MQGDDFGAQEVVAGGDVGGDFYVDCWEGGEGLVGCWG